MHNCVDIVINCINIIIKRNTNDYWLEIMHEQFNHMHRERLHSTSTVNGYRQNPYDHKTPLQSK